MIRAIRCEYARSGMQMPSRMLAFFYELFEPEYASIASAYGIGSSIQRQALRNNGMRQSLRGEINSNTVRTFCHLRVSLLRRLLQCFMDPTHLVFPLVFLCARLRLQCYS